MEKVRKGTLTHGHCANAALLVQEGDTQYETIKGGLPLSSGPPILSQEVSRRLRDAGDGSRAPRPRPRCGLRGRKTNCCLPCGCISSFQ